MHGVGSGVSNSKYRNSISCDSHRDSGVSARLAMGLTLGRCKSRECVVNRKPFAMVSVVSMVSLGELTVFYVEVKDAGCGYQNWRN